MFILGFFLFCFFRNTLFPPVTRPIAWLTLIQFSEPNSSLKCISSRKPVSQVWLRFLHSFLSHHSLLIVQWEESMSSSSWLQCPKHKDRSETAFLFSWIKGAKTGAPGCYDKEWNKPGKIFFQVTWYFALWGGSKGNLGPCWDLWIWAIPRYLAVVLWGYRDTVKWQAGIKRGTEKQLPSGSPSKLWIWNKFRWTDLIEAFAGNM